MGSSGLLTPTYSVLAGDARFRAILAGAGFAPTVDTSALLREWDRAGYRYVSLPLAKLLGAAVAVLRNPGDAFDIARELGREGDAG